jgi:dipeptidyl aminopeptidase/acylaminoacyl peptidase
LRGAEEDHVLANGYDFFSSPRLSPDGRRLAWVAWNHPHMPWSTTELWLAELNEAGEIVQSTPIAGGTDESVIQPVWSPDGVLYFLSDRSGWWNIYRWLNEQVEVVASMDAEMGAPQWVFGCPNYAFSETTRIIFTYCTEGKWNLAALDTKSGEVQRVDLPYCQYDCIVISDDFVAFKAGSATESTAIIDLDLTTGETTVVRASGTLAVGQEFCCEAQSIQFNTIDGNIAYAFYYPPHNPVFEAPADELPPLIVMSHGGPTGQTNCVFDPEIQYWTSRGFAVVDVNYGGSTGYGRAYRERLNDKWGIVDVDDCVYAARYLVEQGQVDGKRMVIRGGSAGGYTTLAALAFRDIFRAGASYYGVSDLELLAVETHKFESRYLDGLIGPYPKARERYIVRSPIHHLEGFNRPAIFLQGLEDKVVPPNQAELMVEALRIKGIPVAYLAFAGEQHGFRQAQNIVRALEAEYYFYATILGFAPADEIEPVIIENFPEESHATTGQGGL